MTAKRIIELFLEQEEASNCFLKSDGKCLFAKTIDGITCIAEFANQELYINANPEFNKYTLVILNIIGDDIPVNMIKNAPVNVEELSNIH